MEVQVGRKKKISHSMVLYLSLLCIPSHRRPTRQVVDKKTFFFLNNYYYNFFFTSCFGGSLGVPQMNAHGALVLSKMEGIP